MVIVLSRIIACAAEDKQLPEFYSMLQQRNNTPIPAILLNTLFTLLFLAFPFKHHIIDYISFIELIGFSITCSCVLVLRKTKPEWDRPKRVSLMFPIISIILTLLVVGFAINDDYQDLSISILIMCMSAPLYFIKTYFISRKMMSTAYGCRIKKVMVRITHFLQKLFLITSQGTEEVPLTFVQNKTTAARTTYGSMQHDSLSDTDESFRNYTEINMENETKSDMQLHKSNHVPVETLSMESIIDNETCIDKSLKENQNNQLEIDQVFEKYKSKFEKLENST